MEKGIDYVDTGIYFIYELLVFIFEIWNLNVKIKCPEYRDFRNTVISGTPWFPEHSESTLVALH